MAQAQNWEREQQAGEVPGQQGGPTGGKDFEHTLCLVWNPKTSTLMLPAMDI